MRRVSIPAGAFTVLFIVATQSPSAQGPVNAQAACDKLAATKLAGGRVTSAQFVAAGALPPPPARGGGPGPSGAANPFADVPALCRVAATMTPSADSNIKIEVWLPATGWNGKLRGTGNGGLGGGTAPAPQRARGRRPPRIRHRREQHRARRQLELRARSSGADQGLRLPLGAPDDRGRQDADSRVLRPRAQAVVDGRSGWRHDCRAQRRAAIPCGL